MVHSMCTAESETQRPYYNRLWRTLFAPNTDPETRLGQLFEQETAEFGVDYAFLSYIDLESETQTLVLTHGSLDDLAQGTTLPLEQTYCRKTIADPEGTMAVDNAHEEGWADDPAYEAFGLESYLGTTVSVDTDLYGTLCFVDTVPREDRFLDEEKSLLEMHGEWVGYVLTLWEGAPIREPLTDAVEDVSISSEGIDSMMQALHNRRRRLILMALLGDRTGTSVETLEGRLESKTDRIQMHHSDLPRLVDAGYVEWDRDAGTVSRGPRFAEVEPLVRLLAEYRREFLD